MATFDTSALVPLWTKHHPRQRDARQAFEAAEEMVVHPCVLAELSTVLRRLAKDKGEDGNAVARQVVAELLGEPRVRVAAGVDHDAATDLYLADSSLSFTDAVVACADEPVAFDERIWRAIAHKASGAGPA